MNSVFIEFIGFSGGFITTSSIIPQIIKCYRSKSTKDLSWHMFCIFYVGMMMTFIYGISIHRAAIYISAIYSMSMNGMIVYMKWNFEKVSNHETIKKIPEFTDLANIDSSSV